VGAVSRCSLLTTRPVLEHGDQPSRVHALFDVEQFRGLAHRHVVVREVEGPTVVLGSTQPLTTVSPERATEMATTVVQRRGGGGAVLLQPGDHLWIEAWIPRDDPLWIADVGAAAAWVGAWWSAALRWCGARDQSVFRGPSIPGAHGSLVCFSGRGPGEVFQNDRKVVGISQWRSREGSLFHTCAYTHWDPGALIALLDLDEAIRAALGDELRGSAVGVADLEPAGLDLADLREALLSSFSTWQEGTPITSA
jgi:lipoate-protein ligase A